MANEALRRMRNTYTIFHWKINVEIITKFSNDLRISGYNASFRAIVIQSAITGFWRQVEAAPNGGPPIDQLWSEERRHKKLTSM